MKRVKLTEFNHQAEHFVGRVIDENLTVKVVDETSKKAAVLVSLKEWESLNETLFILHDTKLMQAIADNLARISVREKAAQSRTKARTTGSSPVPAKTARRGLKTARSSAKTGNARATA